MQWKKQDLRLLLLKIIVKTGGFMTASVMARLLLALGYFIYDGNKRGLITARYVVPLRLRWNGKYIVDNQPIKYCLMRIIAESLRWKN